MIFNPIQRNWIFSTFAILYLMLITNYIRIQQFFYTFQYFVYSYKLTNTFCIQKLLKIIMRKQQNCELERTVQSKCLNESYYAAQIADFFCESQWGRFHLRIQLKDESPIKPYRLHIYLNDIQIGVKFQGHYQFYQLPKRIQDNFKTIKVFSMDFKKIIQTKNYHRLKILQNGDIIYSFQINALGTMVNVEETIKTQQKSSLEYHSFLMNRILALEEKSKSHEEQKKRHSILLKEIKENFLQKNQQIKSLQMRISFLQEMHNKSQNKTVYRQNLEIQKKNIVNTIQGMMGKIQILQVLYNKDIKIEEMGKQTKKMAEMLQQHLLNQQKNLSNSQKIIEEKIQSFKQTIDQTKQNIKSLSQQVAQQKENFQTFIKNSKKYEENLLIFKQQMGKNQLEANNTLIQMKKNHLNLQEQIKLFKQNTQKEIKVITNKLASFNNPLSSQSKVSFKEFFNLKNNFTSQLNQIRQQEILLRKKTISRQCFKIAPFISNILQNQNECQDLFKMFGDKKVAQMKMLFKASQHGFLASQFHRICDAIPNTLTLIKTDTGKKIGGFTTCKWNGKFLEYSKDKSQSFLFSLTKKTIFTHLKGELEQIYNNPTTGPVFRSQSNIDLQVSDKSHINDSYANPGQTYSINKQDKTDEKDENYQLNNFIGCQDLNQQQTQKHQINNFKIIEYEVYQIDFQKIKKQFIFKRNINSCQDSQNQRKPIVRFGNRAFVLGQNSSLSNRSFGNKIQPNNLKGS